MVHRRRRGRFRSPWSVQDRPGLPPLAPCACAVCPTSSSSGTTTSAASGTSTTRAPRCTSRRTSSPRGTSPGFFDFPMPARYADYPSRTEILEYTHSFADAYGLRAGIWFGSTVMRGEQAPDGSWMLDTSHGAVRASALVCCTGVTWDPRMPEVPGHFDGEIIHSVRYRDPSEFAGRRVLIVGLGNSGADIACDAAVSADAAFISTRRGYHFIPKFIAGSPSDQTEWLPIWGERLLYRVMRPLVIGDVRRWGLPEARPPAVRDPSTAQHPTAALPAAR